MNRFPLEQLATYSKAQVFLRGLDRALIDLQLELAVNGSYAYSTSSVHGPECAGLSMSSEQVGAHANAVSLLVAFEIRGRLFEMFELAQLAMAVQDANSMLALNERFQDLDNQVEYLAQSAEVYGIPMLDDGPDVHVRLHQDGGDLVVVPVNDLTSSSLHIDDLFIDTGSGARAAALELDPVHATSLSPSRFAAWFAFGKLQSAIDEWKESAQVFDALGWYDRR